MADQPQSYWQQRYEKARAEGTRDGVKPLPSDRPEGALTGTPRLSLFQAVLTTSMCVLALGMTIWFPNRSQLVYIFWPAMAFLYWRSYLILRRFALQRAAQETPSRVRGLPGSGKRDSGAQ